jgi:RHS repeat-associated protein
LFADHAACVEVRQDAFDKPIRLEQFESLSFVGVADIDEYGATKPGTNSEIVTVGKTTSYYNQNRLVRSIDARDNMTETEYDDFGRQVASIGPMLIVAGVAVRHRTETVFDIQGRTLMQRSGIIQDESGMGKHDYSQVSETTYTYDDANRVVRTTYNDGSFAQVRYDALGRKIAESKQVAKGTALTWSPADRSFQIESGALVPTRYTTYDDSGRMVAVELGIIPPSAISIVAQRPKYEYAYNASGSQTLVRDPLLRETRFEFDSLGRQIKRTLPLGYGNDGKLGTSDDASATSFFEFDEYDSRGRRYKHTSFEGVVTISIYDDKTGRMIKEQYFSSGSPLTGDPQEERRYGYDDYGRVKTIEHFVGVALKRREITEYDDEGRILKLTNDEGVVKYTYDVHGSIIVKEASSDLFRQHVVNAYETTTFYTYDALGRLKTVSQRDQAGVTQADPEVKEYLYDLVGNLDQTKFKSGIIQDNDYDSLNRLKALRHWQDLNNNGVLDANELRAEFKYELRPDGKRKIANELILDNDANRTVLTNNTFEWSYDEVDRLVSEVLTSTVATTPGYSMAWSYDLTGNRTSQSQTKLNPNQAPGQPPTITELTTYSYDANDRLDSSTMSRAGQTLIPNAETVSYQYNKTQQSRKSTVTQGTTSTSISQDFIYDLQGTLREVITTKSSGGATNSRARVVYGYDSSGTRIRTSEFEAPPQTPDAWSLKSVTEYLTDSQNHTGYSQVLQETESGSNNVATKKTVYAIGHDQISQSVFQYVPPSTPGGSGTWVRGTKATFGTDGHGSVRVLYDLAGAILRDAANVAQVYTFDAYGNLLGWTGAQPLTTYLYSGESFDFRIGQQYLRARFYDATNGRFNRLDPFAGNSSDPQSFHKYAYVHGDPIQGIDPTGMFMLGGMLVGSSMQASLGEMNGEVQMSVLDAFKTATEDYSLDNYHRSVFVSVGIVVFTPIVLELAMRVGGLAGKMVGAVVDNSGNWYVRKELRRDIRAATRPTGRHLFKHIQASTRDEAKALSKLPGRAAEASYFPEIIAATKGNWVNFERSIANTAVKRGMIIEEGGVKKIYHKCEEAVGYSQGKEARWIKVELSSRTIHSYPQLEDEIPRSIRELEEQLRKVG